MAADPDLTKSRRCPYCGCGCGCGFEPTEPSQRCCSSFCEHEDRKKRETD